MHNRLSDACSYFAVASNKLFHFFLPYRWFPVRFRHLYHIAARRILNAALLSQTAWFLCYSARNIQIIGGKSLFASA